MAPGRAKVVAKEPQELAGAGAGAVLKQPLHPYEELRLKQCMRNNSRLQQLGIPALYNMLMSTSSISQKKTKQSSRNNEDSESEYDPAHDDTTEGDLLDDDSDQRWKGCNKRTADMRLGATKTCAKRVYAEPQTTITTRSKKKTAHPDVSLVPSHICVPSSSLSQGSQVEEVANFDGHTHATVEANASVLFDNTHMANEGHAIAAPNGHNQMGNEDNGPVQIDDNITNGGEDVQLGENNRWQRGVNMGRGLHRMNRAMCGKLKIFIPEGRIRPVVPLAAAKFATECNIAVRNHVPVFKHWKDYKNHSGLFKLFAGKLSAKFNIDTSDAVVEKACTQMMKNALRQQQHRLKKKYFDPLPLHLVRKTSPIRSMTDEQWNDLVESWKSPKKMETCQKNKENRSNVKYHQTTGSRSYLVHVENLEDKYIDQEPDALELFKECHYSKKKKGYTSTVQQAITQMENKLSAQREGEEHVSVTEVVADVLADSTKKSMFLQNVGIQNACTRSSMKNIEAQLEVEKRANDDLRSVVNTQREQLDMLSNQMQEIELASIREQDEMKKKQAEMEAKLQLVLSQIQPR